MTAPTARPAAGSRPARRRPLRVDEPDGAKTGIRVPIERVDDELTQRTGADHHRGVGDGSLGAAVADQAVQQHSHRHDGRQHTEEQHQLIDPVATSEMTTREARRRARAG